MVLVVALKLVLVLVHFLMLSFQLLLTNHLYFLLPLNMQRPPHHMRDTHIHH